MTCPAIRVENLGKRYVVDHQRQGRGGYRTLRESLAELAQAPFRRLRGEGGMAHEEFWALKDVSFEVQPGEVVGIIGRNGAGKSTLLKILSQITKPTKGRVELNGRVGSLLEVGTGFHPELTGRENIYLNGSILGMKRTEIKARFDEIVAFAEIEQFLDTPVKRYSSGMYVRLAFAVAAHLEPEILIVDEVLAVGDLAFQRKCLGRMKDIAARGRTVLFVSHNLDAINQLTSRCIHLRGGAKSADGDSVSVVKHFVDSFNSGLKRGEYLSADHSSGNRLLSARVHTSRPGALHDWSLPIHFEFRLKIDHPTRGLTFSFQVLDHNAQPVVYLWHFDYTAEYTRAAGCYTATCTVPSIRLYMGEYTLKTWLSDSSTREQVEVLDSICPFEITLERQPRSVWGWSPGACKYIEEQNWTLTRC